jgi:REP element-mobilizing transposase RayT
MILNEIGKIVDEEWNKTEEIRENIELDYFVVMPNHIHGILILDNVETTGPVVSKNSEAIQSREIRETNKCIDKLSHGTSTTLRANSLGSIIGQFKSICTKRIRKSGNSSFQWQPRFYDRIIRNDRELYQIRKYIEQNPMKWDIEKNIPDNLDVL